MSEFNIGDEVRCSWEEVRGDGLYTGVGKVIEIISSEHVRVRGIKLPAGATDSWHVENLSLVNRPVDLYPGETVSCVDEKTGQIEEITLGGTKHDNNKPDLSLLPLPALVGISEVLTYGAGKYGRDNYRKGFSSDRLVAACLRHLHAWNNGEDNDPESGLSHLGHAAATLVMLLTNQAEGKMTDTRYKGDK